MRSTAILAILLLTLSTALVDAQIYKWKDKNGVTHYTSTPPPSDVESEEVAGSREPDPEPEEGEETDAGDSAEAPEEEEDDGEQSLAERCATAVREARDSMDTYLETARQNLKGGYIKRDEYRQAQDAFAEMRRVLTEGNCRAATGREREFFDCLAGSYGDVFGCGTRHLDR